MRLTIHIGPHKTGTTALQSACADGHRVLRRAGVLYPKCNWMYPAQHRLAFALKGRRIPGSGEVPDRNTEMAALNQAIQRQTTPQVLISSEEFFAAPPDAVAWLRDRLGVTDVQIVAFTRWTDRFLVSCYSQKLRQSGNGFDAPIRRFLADPKSIAPEIDFQAHVATWADIFGDGAIRLQPYESSRPLPRVLELLGLPTDLLADRPGVNESPSGVTIETIRHAKRAGLSAVRQKKLARLATRVFADEPPFQLPTDHRLRIVETFERDNDRLFSRFGMKNPYTVANFEPVPEHRNDNINVGDLMRLLDSLL